MAIYKDKKRGTYYVSVYVELKNGERKRIMRRRFKTKAEAIVAEADIILNDTITNADNPKFNDVVDEYINWYEKRRKETSVNRLKKETRLYIKPFFKNKFIQEIKRRDIMKFQDFLLYKLSVTTSKNVHSYLSAIFNYAIQMEYTNNNVAREVGNIKVSEITTFNYYTLDEFREFLKKVKNFKYQTLFMCLFYSGARIGELLALTCKVIDLENNTIDINKTSNIKGVTNPKTKSSTRILTITCKDIDFENNTIDINKTSHIKGVTTPKTKSSIRILKMPNHTMNLLRKLKLQNQVKEGYFVFGEFYDPLSQNAVTDYYNKLFTKKEKRIRIHDFRHSHASYLINSGYDIQIVSKRLGHAKISTTYDIYAHLYPNKEDEAIEQMEDDFKSADVIKIIK